MVSETSPRCRPDILERAKIIAEKMGDRRIYYAGCWTLAEDLGYSKTGENTEFKEVAHPEDFIWCEVLPGINLLPELIAEVERLRSPEISGDLKKKIRMIRHCLHNPHSKQQAIDAFNAAGELARLLAAKDARIADQEAYIERLEAAFLKSFAGNRYLEFIIDDMYVNEEKLKQSYRDELKAAAEKQAREALERIKEGGKDD